LLKRIKRKLVVDWGVLGHFCGALFNICDLKIVHVP